MPDISMCASTDCPLAKTCRRSEASGTVPSERQSWMAFDWREAMQAKRGICAHYWEVRGGFDMLPGAK